MPRGGARVGAGRKPGSGEQKTRQDAIRILGEGVTPLDYIVNVMRGIEPYDAPRFKAAEAAAPYMHARLAAIEHKGNVTVTNVARLPETARTAQEWASRHSPPSTH